MKKIALFVLLLAASAQAEYLGGIAAIVENEPITDYQVEQVMAKTGANPTQALNALIRERFEDAQIKVLNISVSDYDVEHEFARVAENNGMSKEAFEGALQADGLSADEFKAEIKKRMQREKLYQGILSSPNQNVNRENAIRFYNANKAAFAKFETANITKYESRDRTALESAIKDPMKAHQGVSVENATVRAAEIDPQLTYLLINTKSGSFTPIFGDAERGFISFFVAQKSGSYVPPFEAVEQEVAQAMMSQERDVMIADYFNKLRVKANIDIVKRDANGTAINK